MNAIKNKVQLIGHLGHPPGISELGGKKMAVMAVATNETYRNTQGEKVTETQWHKVVAWGKIAEICEEYLNKGTEIVIEGRLIHRQYTDKLGVKQYVTWHADEQVISPVARLTPVL